MSSTFTKSKRNHYSYEEAVALLNSCQTNAAVLEAIRKAGNSLNKLSIPEMNGFVNAVGISHADIDNLNVIHIAGTKGKGSTSAICESILRQFSVSVGTTTQARHLKTGLFISPHLVHVRERIRIDGKPISESLFANSFGKVWDTVGETKPGYFRFTFLMALQTFIDENVDVAILETGIGGEYDATNIVQNPYVTAITSLGYDHQNLLGHTIGEIAWHKAGIMKEGVPCITSPQPPEALGVLRSRAIEKAIANPLSRVGSSEGLLWEINDADIAEARKFKLGLRGSYQYTNAAVAKAVCEEWVARFNTSKVTGVTLHSGSEKLARGLASVKWEGRCQLITLEERFPGVRFYVDGAHTPESLSVCAEWYEEEVKATKRTNVLLFYCYGGRNPDDLLLPLSKIAVPFTHVIFCNSESKITNSSHVNNTVVKDVEMKVQLGNKAAWERVVQGTIHADARIWICGSLDGGLDRIKEESEKMPINVLVTGSMYLVGGVLTNFGGVFTGP